MTDWNTISDFMRAVVAWPGEGEPGYVNLHYSMVDTRDIANGLAKGMGWPFRDVQTFVQRAAWVNGTNNFKDVWFCTSLQKECGTSRKGKPKAIRSTRNALKLKSIWIDVDVGVSEPGKKPKYPDIPTALKALFTFFKKVGLPDPSAIVYSGGGIHLYWIAKDAMTPDEWLPFASGLKNLLLANGILCDTGLTTDAARIMRVPGTFNHKPEYGQPRPVTMADMRLTIYDFDQTLGFIKQYAGPVQALPGTKPAVELFFEGKRHASFNAAPVLKADPKDTLGAGVEFEAKLLDPRPIFKECGFYREALRTGGANHDQPLWNLAVLGTTFMENGNVIAHKISELHRDYSEAGTQALYDRKVAERADRGLGYPSCATIAGAGCKECPSCPLFSKGKSPLNIRPVVTATVNNPLAGPSAAAVALKLPESFDLNDDGIICKFIEKTNKEGEIIPLPPIPLFQCQLSHFWVQKNPDCLNYKVTTDKGFTHDASVPMALMPAMGFAAYLAGPECRTLIHPAGKPYLEEFYLSMLGKLRNEKEAQEAVPFGWYEKGGKIRGFVYGGHVMEDTGEVRPCGIGDPNIKRNFTPQGELQPWLDACATVTNRRRPELTAIMLVGFAGPLIALSEKNSVLYSAWGDSGAGKSAAYAVGMAIWGHPLKTKGSESSTQNNIMTQMKETKNLPFYWDEIVSDKHRERVKEIMHIASDGVEKGRNLSGTRTQDRGTFKLPIIQASNKSFREYLYRTEKEHAAGPMRCIEWWVQKIDGGPGHMSDAEASSYIGQLDRNYGIMGLRYARYLADNHVQIRDEVIAMCNEVQDHFDDGNAERFWITGTAVMILAARYATALGVPGIYEHEIKAFMYDVYAEQKRTLAKQGMLGAVGSSVDELLTAYLKDRGAEERVLYTNYAQLGKGRPPKPVIVLNHFQNPRNNSGGIEVRVAVENRMIIIGIRDFEQWCERYHHSSGRAISEMEKKYRAFIKEKVMIGSGTDYGIGRERVIILPVSQNDEDMWNYLLAKSAPEERAAMEAGTLPVFETGLEEASA